MSLHSQKPATPVESWAQSSSKEQKDFSEIVLKIIVIIIFCSDSFLLIRAKYHKLKYGTELNQGDMKPPSYDSGKSTVAAPHLPSW